MPSMVDGLAITADSSDEIEADEIPAEGAQVHRVAQRRVHALSQNEIDAADGVPTEWSIVPGSEGRGL
jgi:predicted regulator of Ras-like GTPase activity (Roadblock/LC7/MglB family)